MGYEVAINKAWGQLLILEPQKQVAVHFLADEYNIDLQRKTVFSQSCNTPAKDFTAIIILHYLIQQAKGLPPVTGEWLNFRELSGVEGYYDAFRRRCLDPIIRKYGKNPNGIFSCIERFSARKIEGADAAITMEVFPAVPVMIKVWKADEEFGSDANIFFDRSIRHIFCTEDIVVLAQIIAGQL